MLLQLPFLELLYLHRLVNCSCRCFFLLICKNIHPQLVFSLLADTLLQKFASATSLFSILQILSCKNLHPQLPFSLSCRYSPAKICIRNLFFLYLADTPLQKFASATCFFSACRYSPSKICIRNLPFLYLADIPLQKFASATCLFSILQIFPCKNLHPQLAFSLSCRYSTLQYTLLLNYSGFLLNYYFDF